MNTEKTGEKKGDKTQSGCCGFDGSRMLEMMGACCTGQGATSGCSTMMNGMMESMKNRSCCPPRAMDAEPEERKI